MTSCPSCRGRGNGERLFPKEVSAYMMIPSPTRIESPASSSRPTSTIYYPQQKNLVTECRKGNTNFKFGRSTGLKKELTSSSFRGENTIPRISSPCSANHASPRVPNSAGSRISSSSDGGDAGAWLRSSPSLLLQTLTRCLCCDVL